MKRGTCTYLHEKAITWTGAHAAHAYTPHTHTPVVRFNQSFTWRICAYEVVVPLHTVAGLGT